MVLKAACPVCGRELSLRESKNGKPYLVCDRCGMQMFVRSQSGIDKLAENIENESWRWSK